MVVFLLSKPYYPGPTDCDNKSLLMPIEFAACTLQEQFNLPKIILTVPQESAYTESKNRKSKLSKHTIHLNKRVALSFLN